MLSRNIKYSILNSIASFFRSANVLYSDKVKMFCRWVGYALESGCCNSPDVGLITTATQYCKMSEAYTRPYPPAKAGPLLHKTHLKCSMVSYNDLGVFAS